MPETKSIYEKINNIKIKLIGIKKTGENKFSDYTYFELGDILPILTPALKDENLFMKTEFSVTGETAKLIIIDLDAPENIVEYETKVGSCTLKASHDVQNLGAAQTYTRRYLIMTAFDISESDIVDAGAEKEEKRNQYQNTSSKNNQKPQYQPRGNNPQQSTTEQLKRNIWELIKMLPKEDQTDWIKSCDGASQEKLKMLIDELLIKTQKEPEQPETPKETKPEADKETKPQKPEQTKPPAKPQANSVKEKELEIY
jgi:hypothetical protein